MFVKSVFFVFSSLLFAGVFCSLFLSLSCFISLVLTLSLFSFFLSFFLTLSFFFFLVDNFISYRRNEIVTLFVLLYVLHTYI